MIFKGPEPRPVDCERGNILEELRRGVGGSNDFPLGLGLLERGVCCHGDYDLQTRAVCGSL